FRTTCRDKKQRARGGHDKRFIVIFPRGSHIDLQNAVLPVNLEKVVSASGQNSPQRDSLKTWKPTACFVRLSPATCLPMSWPKLTVFWRSSISTHKHQPTCWSYLRNITMTLAPWRPSTLSCWLK